ncbi:MAG: GAF domain-containing protein, partial [Gammaproteobacteria bacterium]|nr:GAF domain-containing protein [Gammaproteobacteria bacterium]
RDEACSLRVNDPSVSRRHARLVCADQTWRISDLASKNGTRIRGRTVDLHQLTEEAWIEFGDVLAAFDFVSQQTLDADLTRNGAQWQTSMQLSQHLKPTLEPEELLHRVLDSFLNVADCERGFVMLEHASGELIPDVSHPSDSGEFQGSRSVVQKTLSSMQPIVCSDISLDAELGPQPSIVSGALRALACLPLLVGDRVIGVLYVDSQRPGKQFTELDIELLQALAEHAALVIGVSRLRENIVDLSAMLPAKMQRGTAPDESLVRKLEELLPQLANDGSGGHASGRGR